MRANPGAEAIRSSLNKFARITSALWKPPSLRASASVHSIFRHLFARALAFEIRTQAGSKSNASTAEAPRRSAAIARIPLPVLIGQVAQQSKARCRRRMIARAKCHPSRDPHRSSKIRLAPLRLIGIDAQLPTDRKRSPWSHWLAGQKAIVHLCHAPGKSLDQLACRLSVAEDFDFQRPRPRPCRHRHALGPDKLQPLGPCVLPFLRAQSCPAIHRASSLTTIHSLVEWIFLNLTRRETAKDFFLPKGPVAGSWA